jgi:transcriptional regulator with XRE-family HTH domain
MNYNKYMSTYLLTSSPILLPVGQLLSGRRLRLGLSPAALGKLCHMSPGELEQIEQGRLVPSPSQAYALARALRMDCHRFCRWAVFQLLCHPQSLEHHVRAAAVTATN